MHTLQSPTGISCAANSKLRNIELREGDFRDLGAENGNFDYIIAHGLYSWVPADVRDRLMALCRELLAPEGVVYLSYNTWPGRHARNMLREILLYHLRDVRSPRRRLREARRLLKAIGTIDAQEMLARTDDVLYHDDLASVNDPVWFRDFVSHAGRHGLQYLGDAGPGTRELSTEAEQYSDFLRMRAFRQSLLCREEVRLDRRPNAAMMSALSVLARDARRRAVASHRRTADAYPLAAAVRGIGAVRHRPGGTRCSRCFRRGIVNLHVFDFPCEETVTSRPRATRLARAQAARSRFVTSVRHHLVELDENDRA